MKIEALTTFPAMFDGVMDASIMGRARAAGLVEFVAHDLRDWTHDVHRTTDDAPYGGGPGLLMKVEPIFEALDDLLAEEPALVVFTAANGVSFTQREAEALSTCERIVFVCGHYEGIDERAFSRADRVYSIGDFVLTGGELPAMVMADAICRLIPGVLGDEHSAVEESHARTGLLEYPQYTRPAAYRGSAVPEILLSGNHAAVAQWRRRQAILKTAQLRPDLLAKAELSAEERAWLDEKLSEADVEADAKANIKADSEVGDEARDKSSNEADGKPGDNPSDKPDNKPAVPAPRG